MNSRALFFSFSGRLNRTMWWLVGVAVYFVFMVGFWVALGLAFAGAGAAAVIGGVAAVFGTLWVGLAVGAKRLHDRDKSAWWLLLFFVAPASLHAAGRHAAAGGRVLSLMGTAIALWAFLELGFLRGTVGPNRYGPDPMSPA
jgi:uncharacterized membrane protein YhaH (DUF805 family)